MKSGRRYSIGELADLVGISRRAVRYYVQRGLVPPPLGAGRGHYYTDDHLTRITAVKELQALGHSLEEIEERFRAQQTDLYGSYLSSDMNILNENIEEYCLSDGGGDIPTLLTRIHIARGVDLTVESGNYRLSPGRLARLRKAVREILGAGFGPTDDAREDEEK